MQIELDALEQELIKIEATFQRLSDGELDQELRRLYQGFGFQTQIILPGMIIHRLVSIDSRPTTRDRVQYPPAARVTKYGRLNNPGEVIFYGSPDKIATVFVESRFEVGKHYALSHWIVREKFVVADCGYSAEVMKELGTVREVPKPFMPPNGYETGRYEILRNWHSRIFTKIVPDGDEKEYRLSIAIAKLFFPNNNANGNLVGGLFYPSVGLRGEADNIALLPRVVDSKLTLFEVSFHRIDGVASPDDRNLAYPTPTPLDIARPDADGKLIWGQKSQIIPTRSAEIKHLPPEYASGTSA